MKGIIAAFANFHIVGSGKASAEAFNLGAEL